jgi:hypothetical protein
MESIAAELSVGIGSVHRALVAVDLPRRPRGRVPRFRGRSLMQQAPLRSTSSARVFGQPMYAPRLRRSAFGFPIWPGA